MKIKERKKKNLLTEKKTQTKKSRTECSPVYLRDPSILVCGVTNWCDESCDDSCRLVTNLLASPSGITVQLVVQLYSSLVPFIHSLYPKIMGILASRGIEYEDSYRSFSEKERQQLLSLFERLATENEHGIMKIEFEPFKVSLILWWTRENDQLFDRQHFVSSIFWTTKGNMKLQFLTLFKVSSSAHAGVNSKPMGLCSPSIKTSCFSLLSDSFLCTFEWLSFVVSCLTLPRIDLTFFPGPGMCILDL